MQRLLVDLSQVECVSGRSSWDTYAGGSGELATILKKACVNTHGQAPEVKASSIFASDRDCCLLRLFVVFAASVGSHGKSSRPRVHETSASLKRHCVLLTYKAQEALVPATFYGPSS